MLIIGLGNPGLQYEKTRHNVGFLALDAIASKLSIDWKDSQKFKAIIASGSTSGSSSHLSAQSKIILAKPQTYMNLSGQSVLPLKTFYKIPIEDIIVIHDDIDLPIGKIKYKIGGGSGGHNGIKSIDQNIGPSYHRIRIGVGRPKNNMDSDQDPKGQGQRHAEVSDFVLSNFSKDDAPILEKMLDHLSDQIENIIAKNFTQVQIII